MEEPQMSYLQEAQESVFKKLMNGDLSVENAVIIWTNFEGKPTKFKPAGGQRTFVLVLTESAAEDLKSEGWNVKTREGREEGDDPLYFTEIVVNMDSKFPPKVMLLTEFRGRKTANRLTANAVKQLDYIDIDNVDLIIHPYEHGMSAVASVKGYAKVVYITQGKDEYFGDKYDEYEEEIIGDPSSGDHQFSDNVDDDEIPF